MENLLKSLTELAVVLSYLSPLLVSLLKFISARTNGKRIDVLESYAFRVVTAIEQYQNMTGEEKKKLAQNKLRSYIRESPLQLDVSETQLDDLLESAVNAMNNSKNVRRI